MEATHICESIISSFIPFWVLQSTPPPRWMSLMRLTAPGDKWPGNALSWSVPALPHSRASSFSPETHHRRRQQRGRIRERAAPADIWPRHLRSLGRGPWSFAASPRRRPQQNRAGLIPGTAPICSPSSSPCRYPAIPPQLAHCATITPVWRLIQVPYCSCNT
jgi:hypothetical protein